MGDIQPHDNLQQILSLSPSPSPSPSPDASDTLDTRHLCAGSDRGGERERSAPALPLHQQPDTEPTPDTKSDDTAAPSLPIPPLAECEHTPAQLHYRRNREKILAYAKIRYKNNRERLIEYSKNYQNERKDLQKERNCTYYERNRERLLKDRSIKIDCACGKVITKGSLASHLRTKYHLKRIVPNDAEPTDTDDVISDPTLTTPLPPSVVDAT